MADLLVPIRQLPHAQGLSLPTYATAGAAGLDLMAAIPEDAPVLLAPLGRLLVPSGVSVELPEDHEAQVRPRSGLAARHGLTVLNAPGTVDCDYRGEIGVLLINLGDEPVLIERGMRIAQLVVARISRILWKENSVLTETPRGLGGFGSTGVAGATGGQDE